jgi:4-amino-4-deoxy-L-arabinose transferase-like glycosyltransferase
MQDQIDRQHKQWLYIFTGFAILLNFTGLFVTIMGPDAALYASIAKHMVEHNNFTDLFVEGKDWLDKPHFPFWITAISFKLFGINTWAYKLPGVLFILMAARYTYKLARTLYSDEVGWWAAIFLLTAQHILICTMDVRAEPYLTGLIIASVYYFHRSLEQKWFLPLLTASIFAACAVMTKGIFALIPIGGGVAAELLIKKNWKMVFNYRWIVAVVLVLLFIIPELYTLYMQFDLHPEKLVFGTHNVSGIKFFFWDSQFGRFFNTGPIKKSNGDPTFFLHTILWAYLPWSLLLYASVYQFFRKHGKQPKQAEWYCIGGSLLTFLVFSVSKFQLPFYIVIVFPFFSILVAQYICSMQSEKSIRAMRIVQLVVAILMVLLIILLQYFFRPQTFSLSSIVLLAIPLSLLFWISKAQLSVKSTILLQVCCVVFAVNLYFNTVYYPELLKYQADSEAAFWINNHNPKQLPLVQTRMAYPLNFYVKTPLYYTMPEQDAALPHKPYLLYADREQIDQMISSGKSVIRLKSFQNYRITRLKGKFLNHSTRIETLSFTEVVLMN